MRIGMFSESYEPVLNGVTVSMLTLTRELKKLGHEIVVFAPGFRGHQDVENRTVRFPSVRTWVAPDYPLAVPYIPGLFRKVRDLELDIIHTHTPFMLGVLGLKLARRLKIPIISTNHTQYTEYAHYITIAPRAFTRSVIIGHLRRYYNRCDAVVVPSGPIKNLLQGYGVQTPVNVIPTGIPHDTTRDHKARSAIRGQYGIPADARVLLYVGRLAREKNLCLLLDSFKRLAQKYPDLHLLIVGGGPFESECIHLASEMEAAGRVVFTGSIPREKVGKYYSAGDLFTFPSTTETQGLVICEALRAGIPCVAVNAGGSPEMVVDGEDGLLTKNDAEDFTAKIDSFLSDQDMMKRFSVKAVKNSERFSPHYMATSMLKVYESVLKPGTSSQ